MSLRDHVPSLELCKKWKEAGGRQDTSLVWISIPECFPEWEVAERRRDSELAAPLEGEMVEWLPFKIIEDDKHTFLVVGKSECDYKVAYVTEEHDYGNLRFDKSLANALMQMAIWQKEAKP
jgi:hypothetical protein